MSAADIPLKAYGADGIAAGRWGDWHPDRTLRTLTFRPTKNPDREWVEYEIDLETIVSSAKMLDWIFQVQGKTWCTPVDAGHLINALDDIFYPQSFLCSGGASKTIRNIKKFLRHRSVGRNAAG